MAQLISPATRVACVIGDPIGHSLSPAMHNAALRHLGIDAVYVAFHVTPADLGRAVAGFRAMHLLGCNVTVPHKERIIRHLDSVSADAKATGAVNTLVPRRGGLHGENTDVIGFQRALAEAGVDVAGRRILLLGAGGAARAVLTALRQGKAESVTIANRTPRRATQLAQSFKAPRFRCEVATLSEIATGEGAARFDLVVNSTSLGLSGEPFLALPFAAYSTSTVFYELIPRRETGFLAGARAARHKAIDGLGMLLHQGAAALEIWTDKDAPIEIMRKALNRAVAKRSASKAR